MSPSDALANVREFRRAIHLLPESKALLPTLLRLLATFPCTGSRIHDAHIVASAVAHKIKTIVSLDVEDFVLFAPRITAISTTAHGKALSIPFAHHEVRASVAA
jgi:predicted nucleic acid-binding protein